MWIPINTNGKVECRNRNPNVSLTRRKIILQHETLQPETGQYIECTGKFTPWRIMNNDYHYMHIWLVEKLYGYNVFAKSQFFPTAKEYILFNYKVG